MTKALSISNQYEEANKVDPRSPQEMIDEAVQTAKQSDVVVAVVGEACIYARSLQPDRYHYSGKANVTSDCGAESHR